MILVEVCAEDGAHYKRAACKKSGSFFCFIWRNSLINNIGKVNIYEHRRIDEYYTGYKNKKVATIKQLSML